MYKIAVDCMGSDLGPGIAVEAIQIFVRKHEDAEVFAYGRKEDLKELESLDRVHVFSCPDVMAMTSGALEAMRARETSMYRAVSDMKTNGYDGVVSAGSTGAFLTLASVKLKNIEGIDRSALVTAIPVSGGKQVTVLDVGANAETSAEQLVQFARMGKVYAEKVLKVKNPKICLLSNGAEDEKGSPEIKEANRLLREMNFEGFMGNIEGREVTKGDLDVLVTGGFAGNVFLKTYEGVAKMFSGMIKNAFYTNVRSKVGYLLSKKPFDAFKDQMNYESVGGAMFIGIKGVVVKAHGSSNARAFSMALEVCRRMIEEKVVEQIGDGV